jgi:hypothetical protein
MAKKDDPNALRSRILTVFLESSVVQERAKSGERVPE